MKNFSLKYRVFIPHACVLFLLLSVLYLFSSFNIKKLELDYQENFIREVFFLIKDELKQPNKITPTIEKLKRKNSSFLLSFVSKEEFLRWQQQAKTKNHFFYLRKKETTSLVYSFLSDRSERKYLIISHQSYSSSQRSLYQLLILTFIIGLISLILFFLIMHYFSTSLRKAIREISEITRSIDLDDYDKKLVKIPQNTFGNLGQEFNHLIKRVRSHLKRRNQIEKIRREFTSNVSHELKTPLTSIKGYTETLIAGAIHDSKNNMRFLKIINTNIDRLTQLVKDLLELSHIESSEKFVKLSPVSWHTILMDSYSRWEVEMKKKKIAFSFDYPENLGKVFGNKRALSHILDNLLQNSYYYNYENGSVHIKFQENEKTISLIIKDTGIGISEKDQKRIFERFFRVDSSRTSTAGHSGIGLAIVKHLVIQLQGSISLKSELEKGSEFTITLKKANKQTSSNEIL